MSRCKTLLMVTLTLVAFSAQAQSLNGRWVQPRGDDRDRADLVIGGRETNGTPLPVCHALYNGSVLPGKLVGGKCNVGFEGREVSVETFELLAGNNDERLWGAPDLAGGTLFDGGEVGGHAVHICRAKLFERDGDFLGLHPGRVVQGACAVTFRGQELRRNDYQVLYASLSAPVAEGGWPSVTEGGEGISISHLACIAVASAALSDAGFTERSGTSQSMVYAHRGHFTATIDCFENPRFVMFVVAGPGNASAETHELETRMRKAFENGAARIDQ